MWRAGTAPDDVEPTPCSSGIVARMTDTTRDAYTFYPDLVAEATVPRRGIHSQTLSDAAGVELVLFSMAEGERLSEHTAARPAIVHVLVGDGELTVAGDTYALTPGAWLRMAARTPHAIVAGTRLVFALYLLPSAE
jgi:quercetin dioxygenase-like cupin family protein